MRPPRHAQMAEIVYRKGSADSSSAGLIREDFSPAIFRNARPDPCGIAYKQ